jgi:Big-like domain-containing protein
MALAAVVVACACSGASAASPFADAPANPASAVVLSVVPANNATNVSPAGPITLAFNHSMMTGMEFLVAVHEGSVSGPQIAGSALWSADRRTLTFTPAAPLKSKTSYVVHLSPNLKDIDGGPINFDWCAQYLGGEPPPTGWTMGGMMGNGGMMGLGWQPGSGMWGYGMIFTFTTT